MLDKVKSLFNFQTNYSFLRNVILFFLIFSVSNLFFDFGLNINSNFLYFSIGLALSSFIFQGVLSQFKHEVKNKMNEKSNQTINKSLSEIKKNVSSINTFLNSNFSLQDGNFSDLNPQFESISNVSIISSTKSSSSYIFHNESDLNKSSNTFQQLKFNLKESGKDLHVLKFFSKNPPQKNQSNPSIVLDGSNKIQFPSTFLNLN